MTNNNFSANLEDLTTASTNIPVLGKFLQSSIMFTVLRKIGTVHLKVAMDTLDDVKNYSNQREALLILLQQLQTAHRFLYEQRLEFYNNFKITSLNKLIMNGASLNEVYESRDKEIYTACLIGLIHYYLGNEIEVIQKYFTYACKAAYNEAIDEDDRESFYGKGNILSVMSVVAASPIVGIGMMTNFKNWHLVTRDEDEYYKKIVNNIEKIGKNIGIYR